MIKTKNPQVHTAHRVNELICTLQVQNRDDDIKWVDEEKVDDVLAMRQLMILKSGLENLG